MAQGQRSWNSWIRLLSSVAVTDISRAHNWRLTSVQRLANFANISSLVNSMWHVDNSSCVNLSTLQTIQYTEKLYLAPKCHMCNVGYFYCRNSVAIATPCTLLLTTHLTLLTLKIVPYIQTLPLSRMDVMAMRMFNVSLPLTVKAMFLICAKN